MLRIFRTNQPLVALLLLAYAFLLRSYQFLTPIQWQPKGSNLMSDWIYEQFPHNSLGTNIAALLLVFIQALMMNGIINRYKMTREVTFIPALIYILLSSIIPEFLYLSPVLMATTFYIIAVDQLLRWFKRPEAAAQIFNVGFWLALGSMFHFSISVFFLLALIGLSNLRSLRMNELLILAIGFFIPYFLMGVHQFWFDRFDVFWSAHVLGNFQFFDWQISNIPSTYLKIIVFTILVLWILIGFQGYFFKTSIQTQKNVGILTWSIFITLISLMYQKELGLTFLLLLNVPLSFFVAFNLLNIERKMIAEIVHLVLVLIVFGFQYQDAVVGVFLK